MRVHIVYPYKYDKCPKQYSAPCSLVRHKLVHKYSCLLCTKRFTNQNDLNKHKPMHIKKKKYRCPKCAFTFKNTAELFMHKLVCYTVYDCSFCKTTYKTEYELLHHECKPKGFTCGFCYKKLPTVNDLNNHRYECNYPKFNNI